MNNAISAAAALWLSLSFSVVHADPLGDCSNEEALAGRGDVVMCEPWESDSWWEENGYVRSGGKAPTPPAMEEQMQFTSIISDDCISGSCLRVETPVGGKNSLSIHWPLANGGLEPEELYFRYYFKIGSTWTSEQCSASGETVWPPSGKFPGFADLRDSEDAYGQCGNGGASSDGIHCWSARGLFWGCETGYSSIGFPYDSSCEATPGARTRIGNYLYVPDNDASHGASALWDNVAERAGMGDDFSSDCRRTDPENPDPDCYCQATNNFYCGIGSGGQLQAGRWYAIEMYVKMNTPGVADGVLRGWVNDQLSYEKTNMLYRKPGHDNLHVRTIWLNIFKGGSDGNCEDGALFYDQMVIATQRIGAMNRPNPPTDVTAENGNTN